MYTYLQNAISMFNNPVSVGMRLSMYNEPVGTMEIFEGDGENSTFVLDDEFILTDTFPFLETLILAFPLFTKTIMIINIIITTIITIINNTKLSLIN